MVTVKVGKDTTEHKEAESAGIHSSGILQLFKGEKVIAAYSAGQWSSYIVN